MTASPVTELGAEGALSAPQKEVALHVFLGFKITNFYSETHFTYNFDSQLQLFCFRVGHGSC